MPSFRVSVSQGRGDLRHNNREFLAKNVDPERVKDDIVFKKESLLSAYEKCFGQSCTINNERQKRKDRMLTPRDYLKKIESGQGKKNNPKPYYESVIQVGNQDNAGFKNAPDTAKKMVKVLSEYAVKFQERNPKLYVFNCVLHADEATPHLHIDWIPVADSDRYKTGMPIRNSLEKALNLQGIHARGATNKHNNARASWQAQERDYLVYLCRSHGIEASWERHDTPERKLSVEEYKKLVRVNDRIANDAINDFNNLNKINKILKGPDILRKAADAAEARLNASDAAVKKQRQRVRDMEGELQRRVADVDAKTKAAEADKQALNAEKQALEQREKDLQARLQALQKMQEALNAKETEIKKKNKSIKDAEAKIAKNQADFEKQKTAFDEILKKNSDILSAQKQIDKLNEEISKKNNSIKELRRDLTNSNAMHDVYYKRGVDHATVMMNADITNLKEYYRDIFDALKREKLFDIDSFENALNHDEFYKNGWSIKPFNQYMLEEVKKAKSSITSGVFNDLADSRKQIKQLQQTIDNYKKTLHVYGLKIVKREKGLVLEKTNRTNTNNKSHDRGRGGGMEM